MIALKNHPKVIERFKNGEPVTDEMVKNAIASIFGIKNVYVGAATKLGVNAPTDTPLSLIWSKKALVYYSEETPNLKSVSFAKTYAKRDGLEVLKVAQSDLAEAALERRVYSKIRVSHKYDQVFVNTACAYLIDNTVA